MPIANLRKATDQELVELLKINKTATNGATWILDVAQRGAQLRELRAIRNQIVQEQSRRQQQSRRRSRR